MKYRPRNYVFTIPNTEAEDMLHLGTLDPEGKFLNSNPVDFPWFSGKAHRFAVPGAPFARLQVLWRGPEDPVDSSEGTCKCTGVPLADYCPLYRALHGLP